MLDLENKRTLRISMFIVLFFSIFQILNLFIPFLQFYFSVRSPLTPDSLIYIIAFPLFFLLPLFIEMAVLALRNIVRNEYDKIVVIVLVAITVLYFIFGSSIYGLMMNYNPYNN